MARGYNAVGDVAPRSSDGRDFADLFAEFRQLTDIANDQREKFLGLFTRPTTSPVLSVLQTLGSDFKFEPASEYGVPQSQRIDSAMLDMGASFKWYDTRWGATWQYLADVTAAELEARANAVIAADSDLVFNAVMKQVFDPTTRTVTDTPTNLTYNVYAFANGDGWVPPAYSGQTFAGSHTHYRVSGGATVTSGDLDEIVADFKSHGYSAENGTKIIVFVNPLQGDVISTFRVASGAKADFIASTTQPGFYTPAPLVGSQPAGTYAGFPVKGSYDEALIIESTRIPAGYLTALASGGAFASQNPILFREHAKAELRGLKLIRGNASDYPLQDSYWLRGFGLGTANRLSGLVMQIKASGSYDVPAMYSGAI